MEYTIIAPGPITGKAWGLNFIEGTAKTDNSALADKLAAKGYRVGNDAPIKEDPCHARVPCPHCGKDYASEETLNAHIKEKHLDAVRQ